jgi:hypothetical protein
MNDIVYVVKSHKRVDRFYDKTYSQVILKYGFELSKVYVFVSTEEDLILYTQKYKNINIIKAPLGVAAVDNFITDFFHENQKIIYMNDDVSDILELNNGKLTSIAIDKLKLIIAAMFGKMQTNRITYAGFYPVANNMFMAGKKTTYNLCLIMDPFSLVINNKKVRVTVSDKSDFEKSIQHFVFQGALLRYNHIALKVEYYGKIGGFQGRNAQTEKQTAKLMQQKYPNYITGINTKNEGKTSLRLKKIKETIIIK